MTLALATSHRRSDLPLETVAASRFLPWFIGSLVYLAVVALAVAAVADRAYRSYDMRAKLVTVTLPAVDGAATEGNLEGALELLRQTRGVTSASPVPEDELEQLIEPWLGGSRFSNDLPLPRLIDVTLDPAADPDLAALQARLREVVPGATIGVEALSRNRAERIAAYFRAWGAGAGIVLLLALPVVVLVTTRTTLTMLHETVELLRLMGAPDRYIARQVERHALINSVRGGLVGFVLAVLTVLALNYSSREMELAGAVELGLGPLDWILLACVPIIAALLVTAVARMTALWRLRQSP